MEESPPILHIMVGDEEIGTTVQKNCWNGTNYTQKEPFQELFELNSVQFKHVDFGETVTLTFDKNPPDSIEIKEDMIGDNGQYLYGEKERKIVPFEKSENKYAFKIEKNLASALSSTYRADRQDLSGFRILAKWGENQCTYAFIVKTDTL